MKIVLAYNAFKEPFEDNFKEKIIVAKEWSDISSADLIIFSGGEDINPRYYGVPNKYSSYNYTRDEREFSIIDFIKSKQTNKYILGVCRGFQLICASFGSPLIQDLYLELQISHPYKHSLNFVTSDDIISRHLQGGMVNSLHHQGCSSNYSPRNFSLIAHYKGVAEILKSIPGSRNNFYAVQFHPEFMMDKEFFDNIKLWVKGDIKEDDIKDKKNKKDVFQMSVDMSATTTNTSSNMYVSAFNINNAVPRPPWTAQPVFTEENFDAEEDLEDEEDLDDDEEEMEEGNE